MRYICICNKKKIIVLYINRQSNCIINLLLLLIYWADFSVFILHRAVKYTTILYVYIYTQFSIHFAAICRY